MAERLSLEARAQIISDAAPATGNASGNITVRAIREAVRIEALKHLREVVHQTKAEDFYGDQGRVNHG